MKQMSRYEIEMPRGWVICREERRDDGRIWTTDFTGGAGTVRVMINSYRVGGEERARELADGLIRALEAIKQAVEENKDD